uniref:Uncharacterized protein n=1 Tax=Rhizophora mucronata TaxID=61149 RepID=A0A2P2IRK4_RHIMU
MQQSEPFLKLGAQVYQTKVSKFAVFSS